MSKCIVCNIDVHPKRVEILNKMQKPTTCLEHSTTQKFVALRATDGKTGDYIDIVTPEQAKRLEDAKKNSGTNGNR